LRIKGKMILTLCTACAAPLPDEPDDAVQCATCATRYCSDRCERYDRRRGGHGKICGAVASGGGAEPYHANKKYDEAVADAVEKCADDTQGQTCFICLDGDAEEGLVRGCSCRGGAGFAHVSCLARQAQVLVAEAEERNLDDDAFNARWRRWDECRLCEQSYHGVVRCALGWACWKTYVGRQEADEVRSMAMGLLGSGLYAADHHEDALPVREAEVAMLRRVGGSEEELLDAQGNLASTYGELGQLEESLSIERDVYSGHARLNGEEHESTLRAANNYAVSLRDLKRFEETKALLRKTMPVARRVLGENDELTLRMRWNYAQSLYKDDGATLDDLREAVATLAEIEPTARRVFGSAYPTTEGIADEFRYARDALREREAPSPPPSESS
jgi:hypothetical protein